VERPSPPGGTDSHGGSGQPQLSPVCLERAVSPIAASSRRLCLRLAAAKSPANSAYQMAAAAAASSWPGLASYRRALAPGHRRRAPLVAVIPQRAATPTTSPPTPLPRHARGVGRSGSPTAYRWAAVHERPVGPAWGGRPGAPRRYQNPDAPVARRELLCVRAQYHQLQ
jgi:hypothetical protein